VDGASAVIYFPRLDRMGRMVSFLERAGHHAVILRPSSWQGELHPLVSFDATRPDSVRAAGIDPSAGLTISVFSGSRIICASLVDPRRFEPPAQARMEQVGQVSRAREGRVALVLVKARASAQAPPQTLGGYAIKGNLSCATAGPDSEALLRRAAKAISRGPGRPPWGPATAGLDDSIWIVGGDTSLQLTGKLDALELQARGALAGLPPLKGGGPSVYGGVEPSGLLMVRARVTADGVRKVLGQMGARLLEACEICDADTVGTLLGVLRHQLTGDVMLRVDRVRAGPGSLKSQAARYFAVKHAALAEVSDPELVSVALEGLLKMGAARTAPDRYEVSPGAKGQGTLLLGRSGRHLYLANDEGALEAALAGLRGPGPLEHGADVHVDPKLVSRAFSQISLLDLMSSRDLAAVLAVGTELGPLLAHSERISGWVDSDGARLRSAATWKLAPGQDSQAPDAGP
jgi:hypothetical protein